MDLLPPPERVDYTERSGAQHGRRNDNYKMVVRGWRPRGRQQAEAGKSVATLQKRRYTAKCSPLDMDSSRRGKLTWGRGAGTVPARRNGRLHVRRLLWPQGQPRSSSRKAAARTESESRLEPSSRRNSESAQTRSLKTAQCAKSQCMHKPRLWDRLRP
jgi:hypothetical protein